MAKYCEYCGKEIDDGLCDCPESVAAREAAKACEAAKADKTAGTASKAEEILGEAGSRLAFELKDFLIGMFTEPLETLREATLKSDRSSQYLVGAILSVITFLIVAIMGDTTLINNVIGRGTLIVFALVAAVSVLIFKAVYALGIWFWARKYHTNLKYGTTFGVFCLTGIYDIAIIIVFTIATAMGIYELSLVLTLFWLVASVLSAVMASWVLVEGFGPGSVLRINVIMQIVILLLVVFLLRSIAIRTFLGTLGYLMNLIG